MAVPGSASVFEGNDDQSGRGPVVGGGSLPIGGSVWGEVNLDELLSKICIFIYNEETGRMADQQFNSNKALCYFAVLCHIRITLPLFFLVVLSS